jgi:hypothetical protein
MPRGATPERGRLRPRGEDTPGSPEGDREIKNESPFSQSAEALIETSPGLGKRPDSWTPVSFERLIARHVGGEHPRSIGEGNRVRMERIELAKADPDTCHL